MRAPVTAAAAALLLALTGCSSAGTGSAAPTSSTDAGPVDSPAPTASSPEPGDVSPAALRDAASGVPGEPVDVTTQLDVPWGLALLPDGSSLITLRDEARVVQAGPGLLQQIAGDGDEGRIAGVVPGGEGGLLGIAISPTFLEDGYVYLYFTAREDNRVVRYTLAANRLGEATPILTGIPKNSTHNGGRIAFGPDGDLYVATGDAQNRPAAQDPNALGGKILRITATGEVPSDNPFPNSPTYSLGHRNPQGLGWDSTGRLIAAEFGQDTWDELNIIRPGGNYGWPDVEGPGDGGGRFVAPVQTWATGDASPSGIAVTSDAVYVAGLRGEVLWRVPLTAEGPLGTPQPYLQDLGRLRTVELGPDGDLWVLTSNTFRGDPRNGDDRLVSVPLT